MQDKQNIGLAIANAALTFKKLPIILPEEMECQDKELDETIISDEFESLKMPVERLNRSMPPRSNFFLCYGHLNLHVYDLVLMTIGRFIIEQN